MEGKMSVATLSAKFQISIPKEIRESMKLKAGQRLTFIQIGKTLKLVPQPSIDDLFGIAKGANTENYRDRDDRDSRLPTQAEMKRRKSK